MTLNDAELNRLVVKLQDEARSLTYLEREAQGFGLMKALQRMEIAAQLAQKRLAELP